MTHAYDENYLGRVQKSCGDMLHFAVHDMGWDIDKFYSAFIRTGVARRIESGDPSFLAGKSGYEMAYDVYYYTTGSECDIIPDYVYGKSPEYFAGWAIAYYSWYESVSFSQIQRIMPIKSIVSKYIPYHEMDIMSFVDMVNQTLQKQRQESLLKRMRTYANLTQKQLAEQSGVSQRMIEQYEQGRKSLAHASVQSVKNLSIALGCSIDDLIAYE